MAKDNVKKNAKKTPKAKKATTTKVIKRKENGDFAPGSAGGPGRPAGMRNVKTIYKAAMQKLAEINKMTPEELEDHMMLVALQQALDKKNFQFYQDTMNRVHGKAEQKVDLTTKEKKGRTLTHDKVRKIAAEVVAAGASGDGD